MKPVTLMSRLWLASRAALPVWVALEAIAAAKGRKRFYVKRTTLARLTGIKRMATLSRVLGVLERYQILVRKTKTRRLPNGATFSRTQVKLLLSVAGSATHPPFTATHTREQVVLQHAAHSDAGSATSGHSEAGSATRHSDAVGATIPVGDRRGNARAYFPSVDRRSAPTADAAGSCAASASADAPAPAATPGPVGSERRTYLNPGDSACTQ